MILDMESEDLYEMYRVNSGARAEKFRRVKGIDQVIWSREKFEQLPLKAQRKIAHDRILKIVFISGLYPPHTKGGGEISTYLLAEALKDQLHEVEVITEDNSHLGLLEKPLFERQHTQKVAARLKEILPDADIIHAHDFRSALALSELNLPNAVVTVRDYAPICGTTNNILADGSRCHCTWHDVRRTTRFQEVGFPRNYARAWQYWYNVPYRKKAFRKLKNQIFISHAQQREIEDQLDLSGITKTVIYNPVAMDYEVYPEKSRPGRILYAGRLEDYKGVRLLLTAWKGVAHVRPEAQLILIGEGAQRAEYEAWVRQQGLDSRVTFKGHLPFEQLRDEYDNAEFVVSPHVWTEPFGRVVAEAMTRGKIVLAADIGGPAEMIGNGKRGILFKHNSMEALKGALLKALAMPPLSAEWAKLDSEAASWSLEKLSQSEIADQYLQFYGKILERT